MAKWKLVSAIKTQRKYSNQQARWKWQTHQLNPFLFPHPSALSLSSFPKWIDAVTKLKFCCCWEVPQHLIALKLFEGSSRICHSILLLFVWDSLEYFGACKDFRVKFKRLLGILCDGLPPAPNYWRLGPMITQVREKWRKCPKALSIPDKAGQRANKTKQDKTKQDHTKHWASQLKEFTPAPGAEEETKKKRNTARVA